MPWIDPGWLDFKQMREEEREQEELAEFRNMWVICKIGAVALLVALGIAGCNLRMAGFI